MTFRLPEPGHKIAFACTRCQNFPQPKDVRCLFCGTFPQGSSHKFGHLFSIQIARKSQQGSHYTANKSRCPPRQIYRPGKDCKEWLRLVLDCHQQKQSVQTMGSRCIHRCCPPRASQKGTQHILLIHTQVSRLLILRRNRRIHCRQNIRFRLRNDRIQIRDRSPRQPYQVLGTGRGIPPMAVASLCMYHQGHIDGLCRH